MKDLEATVAERDAAISEVIYHKTCLPGSDLSYFKLMWRMWQAKLRHSDLESALASAQRGAEEHGNLRMQKEKELQEKEQQIEGYERRLKAAEVRLACFIMSHIFSSVEGRKN